jgi:hypothetical protein
MAVLVGNLEQAAGQPCAEVGKVRVFETRVRQAQARCERGDQGQRELRIFADRREQISTGEHERLGRVRGDHRRGARPAVEDGDLADAAARADQSEHGLVTLGADPYDFDAAAGNDEERVCPLVLADQHLATTEAAAVEPGSKKRQCLMVEPGEERDVAEKIERNFTRHRCPPDQVEVACLGQVCHSRAEDWASTIVPNGTGALSPRGQYGRWGSGKLLAIEQAAAAQILEKGGARLEPWRRRVIEPSWRAASGETVSVETLASRCREEMARFRRGEPCEDRFCLELFRRAVIDRDEACWRELHALFSEQVLGWCRQAGGGFAVDPEEAACIAWERFWRYFTPAKFAAAKGAGGVLRYLKLCARSAVLDAAQSGARLQSLDAEARDRSDGRPTPADAQADRDARARFWAIVNANLHDSRERLLAHLGYEVGLRPCEIRARRPDLFPSSEEVYRLTRNIVDRLRRNRDLSAWLRSDDDPCALC